MMSTRFEIRPVQNPTGTDPRKSPTGAPGFVPAPVGPRADGKAMVLRGTQRAFALHALRRSSGEHPRLDQLEQFGAEGGNGFGSDAGGDRGTGRKGALERRQLSAGTSAPEVQLFIHGKAAADVPGTQGEPQRPTPGVRNAFAAHAFRTDHAVDDPEIGRRVAVSVATRSRSEGAYRSPQAGPGAGHGVGSPSPCGAPMSRQAPSPGAATGTGAA